MKTIVILNGTGFVGKHLCAALVKQGYTVRVLCARPEKHKAMTVLPTLFIKKVDIFQQNQLTAACKGADVVINLCEESAHSSLPQKIVQACIQNNIHRVLHLNTEHYVSRQTMAPIHITHFRPSVIFGPGDLFLNRYARCIDVAPGFMFLSSAQEKYAPVYVGDIINALIQSIDNAKTFGQRYELCGPHVYTLKELVAYIAKIKQVHCKIIGLPALFSKENTTPVCKESFPAVLNITPTALESIALLYLL